MKLKFLLAMFCAASVYGVSIDTIQQIDDTIPAGAAADTIVLSGFTAQSRMVPMFATWAVQNGQSQCVASNTEVDIYCPSSDTMILRRAQAPNYAIYATVQLVQFASNCVVQSGTYTIGDNADSVLSTMTAVPVDSTILIHHYSVDEITGSFDSRPSVRLVAARFNSATTARFRRGSAGYVGVVSGHWWAVTSNSWMVQHGSYPVTTDANVITQSITSVNLTTSFLISSYLTTENTYNGEVVCRAWLSDASTISWQRYYGVSRAFNFDYQVVSDPSIAILRGDTTTSSATVTVNRSISLPSRSVIKSGGGYAGTGDNGTFEDGSLPSRFYRYSGLSGSGFTMTTENAQSTRTTWEILQFDSVGIQTTQYSLTVNNDGHGTTTPSGAVTVDSGAGTAIQATPSAHYYFRSWSVTSGNGVTFADSNDATTTCALSAGNATIQANFTIYPSYTLTVSNDGHGTTTPSGATSVDSAASNQISATASDGYTFYNWTVTSGTGVTIGNQFQNPTTAILTTGNATIQANFSAGAGSNYPLGYTTFSLDSNINYAVACSSKVTLTKLVLFAQADTTLPLVPYDSIINPNTVDTIGRPRTTSFWRIRAYR